jgi:hypothetical protein
MIPYKIAAAKAAGIPTIKALENLWLEVKARVLKTLSIGLPLTFSIISSDFL